MIIDKSNWKWRLNDEDKIIYTGDEEWVDSVVEERKC